MRAVFLALVFTVAFAITRPQAPVYRCDFDTTLTGDCLFSKTTGLGNLIQFEGLAPVDTPPTRPLSDIQSILSPTTPNNELCQLPSKPPTGTWDLYYCLRVSNISYTCPTASGTGNCNFGKYGLVRVSQSPYNQTFSANLTVKADTVHCLDFYYYIMDAANNEKIEVGLESERGSQTLGQVVSVLEPKWQQSRIEFTSSSAQEYKIWFRLTRERNGFRPFNYALDEIQVFEGACGAVVPEVTESATTDGAEATMEETAPFEANTITALPAGTEAAALQTTRITASTSRTTTVWPCQSTATPPYAGDITTNGDQVTQSTTSATVDRNTATTASIEATKTSATPTSSSTASTTVTMTPKPTNLGSILGLSLRLVVSSVLGVTGFLVYCF